MAVGSRSRERAEAQAAEFGIERAHGSYEDVLADPDVEAVYIALPNALHVDWSVRALEAGKHVLCEKPLSRHPEEVERAFDAADGAGRVLAEAFMWRHHPQAQRLVELLPRSASCELVRAAFSFPLGDPGDVRLSRELEGGALMDVGCYCVSGSRLMAGEPLEVSAFEVIGGDGVDARLAATLRFEGDVLGHFDCALDCANRNELEVTGWDGTLLLRDPWHSREPVIEVQRGGRLRRARRGGAPRTRTRASCATSRRRWRASGEPLLGRDDALGQARTISALYESAATGRPVAGRRVASRLDGRRSSDDAAPRPASRRSPALGPRRDRPAGRARADPSRGRRRAALGRARARLGAGAGRGGRGRGARRRDRRRRRDLAAHRRGPARGDGRLPPAAPAHARQPARGRRLPGRDGRLARSGAARLRPDPHASRAALVRLRGHGRRDAPVPARARRHQGVVPAHAGGAGGAGAARRGARPARLRRVRQAARRALRRPWFARATFEAMDALGLRVRPPRRQQHGRAGRDRGGADRPLAGQLADAPLPRARLAARPPLGAGRAATATGARPAADGAAPRRRADDAPARADRERRLGGRRRRRVPARVPDAARARGLLRRGAQHLPRRAARRGGLLDAPRGARAGRALHLGQARRARPDRLHAPRRAGAARRRSTSSSTAGTCRSSSARARRTGRSCSSCARGPVQLLDELSTWPPPAAPRPGGAAHGGAVRLDAQAPRALRRHLQLALPVLRPHRLRDRPGAREAGVLGLARGLPRGRGERHRAR